MLPNLKPGTLWEHKMENELLMIKGGYGGSAWESNPPKTVLAPYTGFEVRELHQ